MTTERIIDRLSLSLALSTRDDAISLKSSPTIDPTAARRRTTVVGTRVHDDTAVNNTGNRYFRSLSENSETRTFSRRTKVCIVICYLGVDKPSSKRSIQRTAAVRNKHIREIKIVK